MRSGWVMSLQGYQSNDAGAANSDQTYHQGVAVLLLACFRRSAPHFHWPVMSERIEARKTQR